MPAVPILHLQPLSEVAGNAWIDECLTSGVESRLVPQRLEKDFETLAEGVVTEIFEAGLRDGLADYVVVPCHVDP